MAAADKDRLTNAIMALVVGVVVLLSRDFIDLALDSLSTWVGGWVRGWGGPGGVFELLFRLLLLLIVSVFALVATGVLWVLSGLNQIYVLPVLAALICYATPWPFRLGFLNPAPYLARAGRFAWDLFLISTYGEYLRRGRGRNIVFVVLPVVGVLALGIGAAGVVTGKAEGIRWTIPSWKSLSIMPSGRALQFERAVDTGRKAGVQLRQVLLGRESTKLRFRFWTTYPPHTKISISRTAGLSSRSYLVDGQGRRYAVTGSEGMELDRMYGPLVIREDRFATLVFEPLHPEAAHFDLHFHSLETGEDWVAERIEVR